MGAGDAFCAAFIYGIHESWNMNKILKKSTCRRESYDGSGFIIWKSS
ncbi:MAG: hypothetical protein ACJ0RD_00565 [Alphaproteobacteria bacterium]